MQLCEVTMMQLKVTYIQKLNICSAFFKTTVLMRSLTRHQCSIYGESSRMAHGVRKRKWAPQTTRDTQKGVQKPSAKTRN